MRLYCVLLYTVCCCTILLDVLHVHITYYTYLYMQYLLYYYNSWCYINAEHGVPSGGHNLPYSGKNCDVKFRNFTFEQTFSGINNLQFACWYYMFVL